MRRAFAPQRLALTTASKHAAMARAALPAAPEATPDDDREHFRTYGTNRVYRYIPGAYHEPLARTCRTPTQAKQYAALMNTKLKA